MAQAPLQPARGTHDLIGAEFRRHHLVIETARRIATLYGFEEWATPIFEDTRVFSRGLGDTSDVVSKEMYVFEDRGGESVTLRPENTAGVCRPGRPTASPSRTCPARSSMPGRCSATSGRRRAATGSSTRSASRCSGAAEPLADAEVIACGWHIQQELGHRRRHGARDQHPRRRRQPRRLPRRAGRILHRPQGRRCPRTAGRGWRRTRCASSTARTPRTRRWSAGAPTIHDHLTPEAAAFYAAVKR